LKVPLWSNKAFEWLLVIDVEVIHAAFASLRSPIWSSVQSAHFETPHNSTLIPNWTLQH